MVLPSKKEKTVDEWVMKQLSKVSPQDIAAFASAIICGLIAHGYMFFNKLPNNDDLICWRGNGGGPIGQGRWLQAILYNFRMDLVGDYSTPWSKGALSLVLFALSAVLIVRTFQVKSRIMAALIGGILITFPTVGMAFCFMFTSDCIAVACFLSCLSTWVFLSGQRKGIRAFFAGILAGACALGTYQAYFSTIATIVLIYLLLEITKDQFQNLKEWLMRGLYYVSYLAVTMLMYLAINKVLTTLMHVELLSMHGSQMGDISLAVLPDVFANMYRFFLKIFVDDYLGAGASILVRTAMLVVLLCALMLLIFCSIAWIKEKKIYLVISIWITTLMMPMAINMVYLMVPYAQDSVYILMMHSLCFVFIIPLLLADQTKEAVKSNWIIVIAVAWSILYYAHFSNEMYLFREMVFEESKNYLTTLATQIKSTPGYDPDMPVVIIGEEQDPTLYDVMSQFDNLRVLLGNPDCKNPLLENAMIPHLLPEWCGFDPVFEDVSALNETQLETLSEMSDYPDQTSICISDGKIIVKLSDAQQ